MSNDIFVWVEQFKGQAAPVAWEAMGLARVLAGGLGGQVVACVLGQGVEALAKEAVSYGADKVFTCDDATLADYRLEPYAAVLAKLVGENQPAAVLMGATSRGREMSGALSADAGIGAIADCTAVELQNGQLVATRPIYAGKLSSTVEPLRTPVIISLRSRAFPKPETDAGRSGEIVSVPPVMAEGDIASTVGEWIVEEGQVNLADARIIVSGGRGVGGEAGFGPVRELAAALGAATGASRAAVDAGWIPYAHQVGQTGKTVSPDMYIACGISGAIQHQAGMRTAKLIVAINKDPEAPIFGLARYGVVGDLFKIVPALAAELKKRLAR
ncbi:MAG: electron transfer flavoprotein subunit alpha/FixB family protein [Thermoflexales bacterium]|nr:electron transfer flavoprotein subunit alpha/FixB family protein [Thermoflexales bacterium]